MRPTSVLLFALALLAVGTVVSGQPMYHGGAQGYVNYPSTLTYDRDHYRPEYPGRYDDPDYPYPEDPYYPYPEDPDYPYRKVVDGPSVTIEETPMPTDQGVVEGQVVPPVLFTDGTLGCGVFTCTCSRGGRTTCITCLGFNSGGNCLSFGVSGSCQAVCLAQ